MPSIEPHSAGAGRLLAVAAALAFAAGLGAQEPKAQALTPNLAGNIERPLRYRPDGGDFVIEDGPERFNRPLYGGNTAFRVDAGDRPEFVLYLPGRGGNLRVGFRTATGARWLQDAAHVVARYRPGGMLYEIADPLLGERTLRLAVYALAAQEGVIARAEIAGGRADGDIGLFWAFGGVTGQRGKRDGDIGTESVPISEYFRFKPEFCAGNRVAVDDGRFTLACKAASLAGTGSPGTAFATANGDAWESCDSLLASAGRAAGRAVVLGRAALRPGTPVFLAVQRLGGPAAGDLETYREVKSGRKEEPEGAVEVPPALGSEDLPAAFADVEKHFAELRARVRVTTPDPFLDAAVGALNVAADAVWDAPQGAIMHGAIAWRTRLLGWRGPYALDALGWHDRARRHFTWWAGRQNTDPVPAKLPPADEKWNLARNEAALHSNGDLSNSHYDMNLVYVDALFRHFQWTGDLALARELWPVIERHLAWERRLFRREFGAEKLPLYEAYAAIWASDDLEYNGGGAAHASAYNFDHNRKAAQIAGMLGADPAQYAGEAALIADAMRRNLWLSDRGMFAEYKDALGLQLVHPSAGLWTFYHAIDSGLPTPAEALRMTRWVDRNLPRLPVCGPGVPADAPYAVLGTSDWMPYTWSINNVVMGENLHAALAYWEAGRPEAAYHIAKGALLESMYMGICPGNVGSMNSLDVYRRESQRDFADGGGVLARALVEGLFGVRPDALAGELALAPGFPKAWNSASLHHPDIDLSWRREGDRETLVVEPRFARPLALRIHLPARRTDALVTVNGGPAAWNRPAAADGPALIEIASPAAERTEIAIEWKGAAIAGADEIPEPQVTSAGIDLGTDWSAPRPAGARFEPVDLTSRFNDRVTNIFRHEYRSPRSTGCSLAIPKQGIGAWAGHVNATAEIDDRGLRQAAVAAGGRLAMPNGVPFATPGPGVAPNILFTSQWDNFPREATVPLGGKARCAYLLMAGSTYWMQSRLDNGEVVATYADGSIARLALRNPTNWWPIEQDFFIDDFQFRRPEPTPPRIDLATGKVRLLDPVQFKGRGGPVPGGAATALALRLDPAKELRSITVRALANEVVIGLMAVTLER